MKQIKSITKQLSEEQIDNLKVGDVLRFEINGIKWPARRVVEIFARGRSIDGKKYVCFYQELGENAKISGSITEGETFYTLLEY